MRKFNLAIAIFLILLSVNVLGETLKRENGGIKLENENYLIDWDMEVTGYSPHGGKFILEGKNLRSKNQDRTVDIAIISPVEFSEGSRAYVWEEVIIEEKNQKQFFCNYPEYGTDEEVSNSFFCNIIEKTTNNLTDSIETNTERKTIPISDEYLIETKEEGAIVYWNESTPKTVFEKKERTKDFQTIKHETEYGSNIYYINDVHLNSDEDYRLRFEIEVDKYLLPVKYTVCFGNFEENMLYFCLDPVIIDSRTWTLEEHFTNNTTSFNLTFSNDTIELFTSMSDPMLTTEASPCYFGFDFDNNITNKCAGSSVAASLGGGASYSTTNVNSYFNKSLRLTGTTGVVNFDNISQVSVYNFPFWAHFWVKMDNPATENFIFQDSNGGSFPDRNVILYLSTNDLGWASDGSSTTIRANDIITDTNWHMIDLVHVNSSEFRIYLDGVLIQTNKSLSMTYATTGSYCCQLGSSDGSNQAFDGYIDNFIWSSDLTTVPTNEVIMNLYELDRRSGLYSDRQGWTPVSGDRFKSISVSAIHTATSKIRFRYNASNSSLGNSRWVNLTLNGTNEFSLNLNDNQSIYYEFYLSDSTQYQTPKITSYTLSEDLFVRTESAAKSAIEQGIMQSLIWPGAGIYTDQKVYLRNLQNSQKLGIADKIAAYGNQRWIFNFGNTSSGFFNISPVIYSKDIVGNYYSSEIVDMVSAFINNTKN